MPSPSILGDPAYSIATRKGATGTGDFVNNVAALDTGTIVASGAVVDFGADLDVGVGGARLDATLTPQTPLRQFRGVAIVLPAEVTFDASGRQVFVSVAHQDRAATAGAGSTWDTQKTEEFRLKMGTATQEAFFPSLNSSINTQGLQRYYKAVVTITRKLASSTAAKDTTTGSALIIGPPAYVFSGANEYPA